ncbi:hypothetical protein [Lapillicoccus sp.]|uniref:hypothetical protein n=1 Tax=Lapillicoccus sp. TaxID=1909287 RepID=UPI003983BC11
MTAFIDTHRDRFTVVAICRVLTEHGCPIAPSTSYAGRKRRPCARQVRDELVLDEVCRVHQASRGEVEAEYYRHDHAAEQPLAAELTV